MRAQGDRRVHVNCADQASVRIGDPLGVARRRWRSRDPHSVRAYKQHGNGQGKAAEGGQEHPTRATASQVYTRLLFPNGAHLDGLQCVPFFVSRGPSPALPSSLPCGKRNCAGFGGGAALPVVPTAPQRFVWFFPSSPPRTACDCAFAPALADFGGFTGASGGGYGFGDYNTGGGGGGGADAGFFGGASQAGGGYDAAPHDATASGSKRVRDTVGARAPGPPVCVCMGGGVFCARADCRVRPKCRS